MAIRICMGGRERQRMDIGAVPANSVWYVHWTGPDSVYEMRRFVGLGDNFRAALHCAELVSMNAPRGDIWLADHPNFTLRRSQAFERAPAPARSEALAIDIVVQRPPMGP